MAAEEVKPGIEPLSLVELVSVGFVWVTECGEHPWGSAADPVWHQSDTIERGGERWWQTQTALLTLTADEHERDQQGERRAFHHKRNAYNIPPPSGALGRSESALAKPRAADASRASISSCPSTLKGPPGPAMTAIYWCSSGPR